jgi:hypothetical protein
VTVTVMVLLLRRPLSSPSVLLLSAIPNASFARTLLARAVASEPRLPSDPAQDRREIRFLGSVPVHLHMLCSHGITHNCHELVNNFWN